jgi:predicted AlkP superfamily phosphohydrolase/phosphomutase
METLVVGLDAACLPVLEPLFEAGVAPTIEELFEDGVAGPLESQIPPWTASAWPSLYTGVNPGKHGVFGFLDYDGYDWDVVNRTDVREHAVWNLLDRHGHTSVVVNVPVTHPPEEIDGAILPGYTAPEEPTCHPEGLFEDLREEIGPYRIYPDVADDASRSRVLREYERLVEMRGDAFRYLADRFDPDFGFVQFQQTDTVFHERPDDEAAVETVYGAVDREVEAILADCDPETTVVVSDHGMGEYSGYELRVNELLRDHGYVETVRGGEGMPSWDAIARNRLQEGESGGRPDPGIVERTTAALAAAGLTSQRIERALDRVGLAESVAARFPTDAIRAATEQVDFPASEAFVRSRVELGVRINLAGRDPSGVVSADEYEAVREDLIDLLSSVQTPDGEPVFETVCPVEEVFQGPYVEDAVDVITVPAAFDQYLSVALLGDRFGPPSEPYNHKRTGVIAAAGAAVDDAAGVPDDANLFDVAPTVLAPLDVPYGDRMDGNPLAFVDAPGEQSYPTFESRGRQRTDDRHVEQQLADLGYLE